MGKRFFDLEVRKSVSKKLDFVKFDIYVKSNFLNIS